MQNAVVQARVANSMTHEFGVGKKRTRDANFDLFLDNSIQSKGNQKPINRARTTRNKIDSSKDRVARLSGYRESKGTKIGKSDLSSQAKTLKNQTDGTKALPDDLNEALVGLILNMFDQIRNVIMEELNLTFEELDFMMTELEINLTDLTNPQALMQLLLYEEGAIDPTRILMDEELSGVFQDMLETVQDIKQEELAELSQKDIQQILAGLEHSEAQSVSDGLELGQSDNVGMDPFAQMDESNKGQGLINSDTKSQLATQEVISEGVDSSNDNQGIIAMNSSNLTNANNDNLSDTANSSAGTDELEGFEIFINNLSANHEKPIVELTGDNVKIYNISDIAQEIIERIRVMAKPGQTTMELRLYPEHLGKVNLTVSSKEGVMSAGFVVQNEMAKEAVERHLIILKENLAEQGIKVDTIDVTVGSYDFHEKNQPDEKNHSTAREASRGRKLTFEEAVAMSEEPTDNENSDYIIGTRGHSINYQA